MHLYDIGKNMWMSVAIFNTIPTSRWGHSMVADAEDPDSSAVYILGGVGMQTYCDSTIYKFDFSKQGVLGHIDGIQKDIAALETRGKGYSEGYRH